jgi:hypothetical protein
LALFILDFNIIRASATVGLPSSKLISFNLFILDMITSPAVFSLLVYGKGSNKIIVDNSATHISDTEQYNIDKK